MSTTTAYERKRRRRNVTRLRAQGYTIEEISEELGYSESTIQRDIDRISSELQKLDDPDLLKRELKKGAKVLLDEEYEDLRRADVESDEKAKHRAKGSFRQTIELLKKIHDEFGEVQDDTGDDWLDTVDDELREQIIQASGKTAEEILAEE